MENNREQHDIFIARIDFLIGKAEPLLKLVQSMRAGQDGYKQLADFTSDVLAFEENLELKQDADMLSQVLPELEQRYNELPPEFKK